MKKEEATKAKYELPTENENLKIIIEELKPNLWIYTVKPVGGKIKYPKMDVFAITNNARTQKSAEAKALILLKDCIKYFVPNETK